MRFAPLIALTIALTFSLSSAVTRGIVGGPTTTGGNNRPALTGIISTPIAVAQGDTLMFGSARDSVNSLSAGYRPWSTSLFNVAVPSQYEHVVSNKDSLLVCVTGVGDADATQFLATLQARAYGSGYTSTYVSIDTATYTFPTASLERVCNTFAHPGLLDFRFRSVGTGATDTTDVYRFEVYDK